MTALVRYSFATLLHSQRYLAPVLLFAGLIGILTVNGSGALPPSYAASAGALFVCQTWLTSVLAGLDDPTQRAVVTTAAGRGARVLAGTVCTALLASGALAVAGLLFPLWIGSYDVGSADLLLGAEAQLVCALAGTAIGLPCSRLLFRRQGYALATALALVLALLFVQGLPPVNRLFHLMSQAPDSAALLAPAAGMAAVAAALLATSARLTQYLVGRRD
ncbi:hypothetical protein DSC45_20035 [Streptomyces sp. YIM 130001]|uniref:hypothetical protein n=1 Tax=Streptomyces sp. YIM 130001 TaxID=2259644 RepID=UPI000E6515DA|nr:hypothetical protein [Streptomyces sp. YIM 130001]RII14644.1 hypothetical protein DSC45_20035 [Streptomyces sp. YIM 130001]